MPVGNKVVLSFPEYEYHLLRNIFINVQIFKCSNANIWLLDCKCPVLIFGIDRHDDYDYAEVNELLHRWENKSTKKVKNAI